METQMNGFLWILLTRHKNKNYSFKEFNYNNKKNKKERTNIWRTEEPQRVNAKLPFKILLSVDKSILSIIFTLVYIFVAPVMQVLPVYAAEPAAALTVWDIILTELVGSNAIITDTAVLNAYSSVLGSMAAETATSGAIDTALSVAAQSCGVELAPIFANTVESAASVGVTAVAATAGENIAATCLASAAIPAGAVVPALGGAVVAGVGLGILYNHVCKQVGQLFLPVIKFGNSIKNIKILADYPAPSISGYGGVVTCYNSSGAIARMFNPAFIGIVNGSQYVIYYNPTSTGFDVYGWNSTNKVWNVWSRNIIKQCTAVRLEANADGPTIDYYGAKNALDNGIEYEIPLEYCPDLSSTSGRIKFDPSSNPDVIVPNIPELRPLPDYENGYGLRPIKEADYRDIATYINNQPLPDTLEGQEQEEVNFPTVINPIIDPYLVPVGDPSPGPGTEPQPTGTPDPNPTGTPDPNPTGTPNPNPNPNPGPNTQPFPDPDTVPQPTPVVNPTPDSEIAPAPVPYPDPETPTEQDKTETDAKITPIDLRDKFPFCIPFDILKIMKLFQGGREAPCFTWTIPFGQAGSGSVTVDLSPWDSAATLLRTLELILFIMLLAVGTRNLIGGS